jgi:hypothetical protein
MSELPALLVDEPEWVSILEVVPLELGESAPN